MKPEAGTLGRKQIALVHRTLRTRIDEDYIDLSSHTRTVGEERRLGGEI